MSLTLYNTLTRRKETFEPLDAGNVRMYVCGPTVYDYAHIGNARPVIVFDVLFRLLRHAYGAGHVTYVRNITDVDDKINARAATEFPDLPLNEAIRRVTEATEKQFHDDIAALGVLPPTVEPRATEHIEEMRRLIDALVANGHAYVAEDHVLFDVASMPDYGRLSNRSLEEMEAGARVEVAPYKKGAMDFVLWKPSKAGEPAWPSPSGIATPGRPGWHIECSAMSERHLGPVFDIHGGGIDLVFPHHENEIAQSRCAHGTPAMAKVWMHNGFLQVEGEKMSKSLGNFITINELLATKKFGASQWHGRVVRLAMLGTHYRQPIDWTADRLLQARATLLDFAGLLAGVEAADAPSADVITALSDDLNTPSALSIIHGLAKSARRNPETAAELKATLEFLGVYGGETRDELNVGVEAVAVDEAKVDELVTARLAARKAKDFKESDRIRDELAAMGVAVKDAKDPATGDIVTTWEIAR
ncbi:cysteine--tRNA ligase [Hyphomicrobium sp.]|uniref:cysteine--tRNA ligase n=1 Tax=Hyphomicrobium sp. TaxID=82 RepID=UPI002C4EC8F2|nr:cysteine--tRNA ligase [Hyphomicrobium sp.]HRN87313.1 cysteine--tRNA ligase [Hyphomicrobium sp.]HRQ26441.1 cysteine--tRNA ligase [Hyphomicrobium sp.]